MVLRIFHRDKVFNPGEKIDEYTVLRLIGEGRFGICYLVTQDGQQFIVKQLKKAMFKKNQGKVGFEEEILSKIQHHSVPRIIKKVELSDSYFYVLESKAGTTFEELIYTQNRVFSTAEIYQIGLQLIDIMQYLHSNGVVHRDIRVPNVLYHGTKVYLVDFGLARWIGGKYTPDIDYAYFGDFLLHLLYTAYTSEDNRKVPWYDELSLEPNQVEFLKRLLDSQKLYNNIAEIEKDFHLAFCQLSE
ncbi:MAG: protein kinase family protein [Clostridia bacterium]|nr:protein kinase family protein [Clostridia bacterium]